MRARLFLFVLLIPLAGCAYVCHDYPRFQQNLQQDTWRISGKIQRFHAAGYRTGPGSWPHWPSRHDDRYRVTLVPIARDTTFWAAGVVEILDAQVEWGENSRTVVWTEILDQQEGAVKWDGTPTYHSLRYGKFRFTSDFFSLPTAVPDTLWLRGLLRLKEAATDAVIRDIPLDIPCPIDLHVRWTIIDALES